MGSSTKDPHKTIYLFPFQPLLHYKTHSCRFRADVIGHWHMPAEWHIIHTGAAVEAPAPVRRCAVDFCVLDVAGGASVQSAAPQVAHARRGTYLR